ncbi:MAG: hypothetical protein AVDCRST_MAG74-1430 [uncultured Pyrinomonadaceae bacterium]|uniref:Nuclease n=1 Tax=uncultured Pyrinomonadaceae bacterium TaxID=2283094 RepID=A0A6J4NV36_9BACT|nr:MAG: hypothetical protein AVDCRST_MAG74-1430 [uncultured Pyrinomonadaceae bacterium]
MLKEKKKKRGNRKNSGTTKEPSERAAAGLQKNSLAKQIEEITADLYYISETDALISPFVGHQAQTVSRETILEQTESAFDSPVEERNFTEFFARLIEIQDWFGDEERKTAEKYLLLKKLLEKNLRDLKVYKIGKVQIDIYIVGLDAENRLMGIKTKAVET